MNAEFYEQTTPQLRAIRDSAAYSDKVRMAARLEILRRMGDR